mgnify:CR=1 FL=1
MPATKIEKMVVCVKVEAMTSFWRYNRYNHRRELNWCITMSHLGDPDADKLVTFTNGKFSVAVAEGDTVTVECRHKRYQEYNGNFQEVVTHCKVV